MLYIRNLENNRLVTTAKIKIVIAIVKKLVPNICPISAENTAAEPIWKNPTKPDALPVFFGARPMANGIARGNIAPFAIAIINIGTTR